MILQFSWWRLWRLKESGDAISFLTIYILRKVGISPHDCQCWGRPGHRGMHDDMRSVQLKSYTFNSDGPSCYKNTLPHRHKIQTKITYANTKNELLSVGNTDMFKAYRWRTFQVRISLARHWTRKFRSRSGVGWRGAAERRHITQKEKVKKSKTGKKTREKRTLVGRQFNLTSLIAVLLCM